jgi:hypothetical protein
MSGGRERNQGVAAALTNSAGAKSLPDDAGGDKRKREDVADVHRRRCERSESGGRKENAQEKGGA